MAALNYLANNQAMITVSLGMGIGYSVLDIVDTFANASNKKIPDEMMLRRAEDVAIKYADACQAQQLLGLAGNARFSENV